MRYSGVTWGLVVPSLRSEVTLPWRSSRPTAAACVGSTSARVAFARMEMPSSGVPAAVQTPVAGSAVLHVGTLIASTVFTVSCSAVSMSDEKICAMSGSYESAPSWLQWVAAGVPFAPA